MSHKGDDRLTPPVSQRVSLTDTRELAAELAALIGEQTISPLLDAKGAATLLNLPESWVRAEARANRIPHVQLGRYIRFDRAEILAWVEHRKQAAPR